MVTLHKELVNDCTKMMSTLTNKIGYGPVTSTVWVTEGVHNTTTETNMVGDQLAAVCLTEETFYWH